MDKLLTVPQVADIFQVTPYTVRGWLKEGLMNGIKPPNGRWRVTETEVKRFANEKYGETS